MNQIEQDFEAARLIARYLTDSLTEEEQLRLARWRNESAAHEELFARLCRDDSLQQHMQQRMWCDATDGWTRWQRDLRRRQQRLRWMQRVAVAAGLLVPLLLLGWVWWSGAARRTTVPMEVAQTIAPGKTQAVLTLDNGEMLSLQQRPDTLLSEAGHTVARLDSLQLNYLPVSEEATPLQATSHHRITTPRGGEYTLTLSDGTRVQLNAESSLRYPVTFGTERREVELTGEALFDVAHTGAPFVVRTGGLEVEVLGTLFNLSAYPDEACQATLVSGRVRVSTRRGESCLLEPAQQATLAVDDGPLSIEQVDTDIYTSWARGKILFKDRPLGEIMKVLSRWYGVETRFADEELKELRFGCHLNRYADITPFVRLLEQTGKVHVQIDGNQILFTH